MNGKKKKKKKKKKQAPLKERVYKSTYDLLRSREIRESGLLSQWQTQQAPRIQIAYAFRNALGDDQLSFDASTRAERIEAIANFVTLNAIVDMDMKALQRLGAKPPPPSPAERDKDKGKQEEEDDDDDDEEEDDDDDDDDDEEDVEEDDNADDDATSDAKPKRQRKKRRPRVIQVFPGSRGKYSAPFLTLPLTGMAALLALAIDKRVEVRTIFS